MFAQRRRVRLMEGRGARDVIAQTNAYLKEGVTGSSSWICAAEVYFLFVSF